MIERTLVLLKPDSVLRGLVGTIMSRFERAGLKIVGLKMVKIDPTFAKMHYAEHVNKPFYPRLEKQITQAPLIAMVLEGANAISVVRKLVGDTDCSKALPGTIRGDFGHMSLSHADEMNYVYNNLVHASSSKEDAKREISIWFKDKELFDYKKPDQYLLF